MNNDIFILTWHDNKVGHDQILHFTSMDKLKEFYQTKKIYLHMHKVEHTTFYE